MNRHSEGTSSPLFVYSSFMEISKELRTLADSCLDDQSHFIVDVIISARQGPKKVLVTVDGDNGIGIDDFTEISRRLSGLLEESTLIDGAYTLEVSSPGIDQPLKSLRQYRKNVGRKIRATVDGKPIDGVLESVTEESIELLETTGTGKKKETKNIQIPFSQIERAFVLISFK